MSENQVADSKKVAFLCEEIENLTREADEVLGEVVKCRKTYPAIIASMKMSENREKFARLVEAPLKANRPRDTIDVEQLQKDIIRKADETEKISEQRKALEMKLHKLRSEYHMWEQRCRLLEEILTKYAPIHALPDEFTF